MDRRCQIIEHITKYNRRGMRITKTDHPETPYFYHDNNGFVMERYKTKSAALRQWNYDNSKASDGRWANIIPGLN